MQKQLQASVQQLMQKDMDRKEFLQHVGVGAAAVIGLTTVIKTLSQLGSKPASSTGYGASVYGGVRPQR